MGAPGSSESSKTFIFGINYPSFSCGRIAQHINLKDSIRKNDVGRLYEYGIVAIQKDSSGEDTQSQMTIASYRIPFLVEVRGTVTNKNNIGVKNVRVEICHINSETGLNDANPNYCPLTDFKTDSRGEFSGEIRVADRNWANLVEYFRVTASLTETFLDGTTVVHIFSPEKQTIKLDHSIGKATVYFIDLTQVSVFGLVLFDPYMIDNNICPFQGVPVSMMDVSTGTQYTTVSASDGSFNFSLTQGAEAYVTIMPYQGHTWRMVNSTEEIGGRRRLFSPHHELRGTFTVD